MAAPVSRRHMLLGTGAALYAFAPSAGATPPPIHRQAPAASWPHTVTDGQASATVYQPQAIAWPGRTSLQARAAVELHRAPGEPPIIGTVEVTAATTTDMLRRSVEFSGVELDAIHFPSLDAAASAKVEERIRAVLATLAAKSVPLDSVLASLAGAPAGTPGVATHDEPPVVFRSEQPAVLVVLDGEPVLAPVADTGLSLAVNTNWDLLADTATGRWYLLDGDAWLAAPASAGPYQAAAKLPAGFERIPADPTYADIRGHLPGRVAKPAEVPTVFVSTAPAEIIVTDGPAQLAPIPGTSLQYLRNSGARVVFDPAGHGFYALFSGRWFAASSLDGPWRYATPDLPAAFARIPADGAFGDVLASVPGTVQAQEAVISAQIPRQATLKPSATITVAYVGAPDFKPIPGTSLEYAVNTTSQVLKVGDKYYACVNGAWFVAASPQGPWQLATSVPDAIQTIPPSSPLHNVTYVHVYSATPEAVVVGYTAGYTMGIVSAAGVVVYGTGYYYPPVVLPARVPVYLPYPYTYCGGVAYNPATGTWARGGTVAGPYATATGGSIYNPATGAYARGGAVYGPNGGAGAWSAYNPATGAYAHGSAAWGPNGGSAQGSFSNPTTGRSGSTTQNWNPYQSWGSSTISGPNKTVDTASGRNANGAAGGFSSSTGAAGAGVHGAGGNNAAIGRTANGDVYAGHDGNAYQHTSSGWSTWNNGAWQPVQPPAAAKSAPTKSAPTKSASASNTVGSTAPAAKGGPTQARASASTSAPRSSAQRPPAAQGQQLGGDQWNQLQRDQQARTQGAAGQSRSQRFQGRGGAQQFRRR